MIKLVKANIHKDRAVLSAFLLIIILSVLLLHVGRMVAMYKPMYDEKIEKAETRDTIGFATGDRDSIEDIVEDVDEIESFTMVDVLLPLDMEIKDMGNKKHPDMLFFMNEEDMDEYQKLNFVEKDDSVKAPRISVNEYVACYYGLSIGDKVRFHSESMGDTEFTVAGIYEDLLCGNSYSYYSTLVDADTFTEMRDKADEKMKAGEAFYLRYLVCATSKDGVDYLDTVDALDDAITDNGFVSWSFEVGMAKTGYTSIVTIVAAFMAAFSVIIMMICFIMIIFTINNNINRDIKNIGALRAVGFTNAQVRRALIMEYAIVAAIGGGIGIALAYILYPILEESVIREISGMVWEGGFHPMISIPIFAGLVIAMIVVTVLSTIKLKNIHPAIALRFGLESHSFKKNYLPLGNTRGGVNMLLALKSTLQSKAQNIIIICIIMAVSFLSAFSAILFYNTRIDITKFQRLLQGDAPDAYVRIKYDSVDEMYDVIEQLQNMDGVSQAYGLSTETAESGGYNATLLWVSKPEFVYCGIYEGDMLKEDNEAVIGGVLAENLGVGVGDEITIEYLGHEATFLVTGLQQAVYGFGERIYISDGGLERLGSDPDHTIVRVRLDEPSNESVDEFLDRAEDELGANCVGIENYYRETRSSDNMPVYATALVIMILIILNLFTIIIVIRLLLKTVFIRREQEFGIKKAVGFTSRQLRFQLALSLIPTSLLAALIGSTLGNVLTNPLFTVIFSSFGVKNSDLIVKPVFVPVTVAIVTAVVFVLTFIMSRRMKRVSAYNLIQE